MDQIKQSSVLAAICWLSVIALTWLLALGKLDLGWITGAAWLFFLTVAVVASSVASTKR